MSEMHKKEVKISKSPGIDKPWDVIENMFYKRNTILSLQTTPEETANVIEDINTAY